MVMRKGACAASNLTLRDRIGGDRWSIDSRDGTFPGRCAARVPAQARENSMNPKETSSTFFLSYRRLLVRPSHGSWSCFGHKRSTKRAGVKVKGPIIAAECHRIVNEIHECVSRETNASGRIVNNCDYIEIPLFIVRFCLCVCMENNLGKYFMKIF